ncbi:zinc finger protein 883-like isoform X2 [Topomyia yanbarensis]|uniref:zinc finger protein 883-like isoform X2 n=1 Tax=Topomyia yanbarensis TaxID=2498891 RepID=UPI00273B6383|nr:zinc finger protein 883-like isoform X2 [Topomyia yanbarensis]
MPITKISADDGLPQKLCETCLSTLTKIHKTIETFRENDRMLRLQQSGGLTQVDIKEEVYDDEEKQAPTHELQIDIIQGENISINPVDLYDQEIEQEEPDDDKPDEEWMQFESEIQSDATLEEEKPQPRRRRGKQTKKSDVDTQQIPGSKRRRIRFKDPKYPRLNDFKCYICKSGTLGTPGALLAHLDSHMNEVPYTCTECVSETVVIRKLTTLNIHKRMHENPYKCSHCDRRYNTKGAVVKHVQTFHLGENAPCPSTCEMCGKVCSSKTSLIHHLRLHTHGATCEFCGKVFIGKHKLRRHIERKHEKLKKYECHLCQKKLCSLESVQIHIETVHSTKEVKCEYCHKSYPSEISLRYHLKKHEQNPNVQFSCDWKEYYTFVEAEDGSKKLKKCNLCGLIVNAIGYHMSTVHFPQEYRCDLCDAVFKRKSQLKNHVLEHKHGRIHLCPICGKDFSERRNLISHLRTKKHRDHPLAKSFEWMSKKRASKSNTQLKSKFDSESEQSNKTKATCGD